jgi:hypothetical protein
MSDFGHVRRPGEGRHWAQSGYGKGARATTLRVSTVALNARQRLGLAVNLTVAGCRCSHVIWKKFWEALAA